MDIYFSVYACFHWKPSLRTQALPLFWGKNVTLRRSPHLEYMKERLTCRGVLMAKQFGRGPPLSCAHHFLWQSCSLRPDRYNRSPQLHPSIAIQISRSALHRRMVTGYPIRGLPAAARGRDTSKKGSWFTPRPKISLFRPSCFSWLYTRKKGCKYRLPCWRLFGLRKKASWGDYPSNLAWKGAAITVTTKQRKDFLRIVWHRWKCQTNWIASSGDHEK